MSTHMISERITYFLQFWSVVDVIFEGHWWGTWSSNQSDEWNLPNHKDLCESLNALVDRYREHSPNISMKLVTNLVQVRKKIWHVWARLPSKHRRSTRKLKRIDKLSGVQLITLPEAEERLWLERAHRIGEVRSENTSRREAILVRPAKEGSQLTRYDLQTFWRIRQGNFR